jgi:DNA-binding transcriptional LysR family regulator
MKWSERIGRRIRLRDLHILLAVVQSKSLATAAQHLAISRPVVSKAIADLEHAVGVRLLERDRHGAEPTIYGAALLKRGAIVFDQLRESVKDIEFLAERRRKIKLAELVNESWALPPPESVLGSIAMKAFRANGLDYPRTTVFIAAPAEPRISLVATGRFLTIVPASALRFPIKRPDVKVLRIELPLSRMPVGSE